MTGKTKVLPNYQAMTCPALRSRIYAHHEAHGLPIVRGQGLKAMRKFELVNRATELEIDAEWQWIGPGRVLRLVNDTGAEEHVSCAHDSTRLSFAAARA